MGRGAPTTEEELLELQIDSAFASNAPPGTLPLDMYAPTYPPPRQPFTFQAPRSYWFYIFWLIGGVAIGCAIALGIIAFFFPTSSSMTPIVAGANQGNVNFQTSSFNSVSHSPVLSRFDALAVTGSIAALTLPVSNVTGVGTAISVEQGGVEVWNGGIYSRDRIVSDTGIGYPSDERVKRNIEPIDTRHSFESINRLKPVTFDYMRNWAMHRDKEGNPVPNTPGGIQQQQRKGSSDDEGRHQRGFIAQEVRKVIPTAIDLISRTVSPDESNVSGGLPRQIDDFHIMDMSAIIPDLVGAVQEMSKQIRALQDQNQELRKQLAA